MKVIINNWCHETKAQEILDKLKLSSKVEADSISEVFRLAQELYENGLNVMVGRAHPARDPSVVVLGVDTRMFQQR